MANPNDELWDPRPRLGHEADHVGADGEVEPGDRRSVLVELDAEPGMSPVAALAVARELAGEGVEVDEEYGAVPLAAEGAATPTFVVRAEVAGDEQVATLERDPRVRRVWRDTPIAPF